MAALITEQLVKPPTGWKLIGALAGFAASRAAPLGAWWFGAVPVALVYGFGTLAGMRKRPSKSLPDWASHSGADATSTQI